MYLSHDSEISFLSGIKEKWKIQVYTGWYKNANRGLIRDAGKNSNVCQ